MRLKLLFLLLCLTACHKKADDLPPFDAVSNPGNNPPPPNPPLCGTQVVSKGPHRLHPTQTTGPLNIQGFSFGNGDTLIVSARDPANCCGYITPAGKWETMREPVPGQPRLLDYTISGSTLTITYTAGYYDIEWIYQATIHECH